MGLDIEKVAMLTGMVDKLIQIKHVDNALDESVVEELIQKALFISDVPYSDDEIAAVKRDIAYKYQIQARPGQSILADYEQANWYDDRKAEIQQNFWTRYKNYLIDEKHFSPNVVSTLGNDTLDQKLMNYILDPKADYGKPVLKRGLIIGDVQSGKTSTYIGFICKAADAGYKVFILLTGTIESLRKQTQERVEEGFIGIDMSANTTGGKRVGVGLDNKPIHAMALTSRASDFRGNSNKIAMSLGEDKDAVVFVIKKNTTTLTKLTKWLIDLNADPRTHKIDMPMLMIDDEADNASINTSSDKEDPTKINKLIRKLADVFTKSNYVGFTATPFANVFIDPETTEKMETHDLFPEDFIVALPTPSNYIGPTRIFPKDAEFHSQLVYITDAGREEEDGYSFYFKHKKDWKGKLPESMTDAIYAFYLANAIRDLRGDQREHRSMLINISRFVKVQKYIKEIVEKIHAEAYRSLKYNLSSDFELSMKDPVLNRIYKVWQSQYEKCGFTWDEVAAALFDAMEKIQIKVVNSSRSSEKLEYPKNESLRVIAIGGLALSRGLTLEGLIISYFYRNTCTYDVLMQMGRWFGYRRGYEDLFRIWTHKASAEWYAEIADATEKLKEDMVLMRDLGQKPRDFGIRVRNNSTDLNITAYNKMRNATDEFATLLNRSLAEDIDASQDIKQDARSLTRYLSAVWTQFTDDQNQTVYGEFEKEAKMLLEMMDLDLRNITHSIQSLEAQGAIKKKIASSFGVNTFFSRKTTSGNSTTDALTIGGVLAGIFVTPLGWVAVAASEIVKIVGKDSMNEEYKRTLKSKVAEIIDKNKADILGKAEMRFKQVSADFKTEIMKYYDEILSSVNQIVKDEEEKASKASETIETINSLII